MSGNHTANSTFDFYLRKLMVYVAKNPGEFVSYGRFSEITFIIYAFCPAFFQIYFYQNCTISIYCLCLIVFLLLSPLMLICGYLSWKLIQMMDQEKKEAKRKGITT